MYTKKIYFAGGSFHELQEVFSRVQGVVSVTAGYINSEVESPLYEDVVRGRGYGISVAARTLRWPSGGQHPLSL